MNSTMKETYSLKRKESLGPYFSLLDDDLLMDLLEYCDERDLIALSLVSQVFYVFADEEELWKTLCIRKWVKDKLGTYVFKGTWRRTALLPLHKHIYEPYKKISVQGFYSPRLYAKWYRSHIPVSNFETSVCTIDRRHNLSIEEFISEYESKNKPVVISGAMDHWKGMVQWKKEQFLQKYGDVQFKTNGTDEEGRTYKMAFKDYVAYMEGNHDDKPIYLFDNKFLERAPEMLTEYEVPPYFREDLFDLMDVEDRPDWRWFLVGPPRSGSPFHQDPHRTSAWNALLSGRKRWTLYPPHVIPPGVDEELIDTEYYAAPDVMKYFVEVYPFIPPTNRPLEIVQEAGEIIFVPSGWWHQVLNLEETVAVTQNFCSPRNFHFVFRDFIERRSKSLKRDFLKATYSRYHELYSTFEPISQHLQNTDSSSDSDSDSSEASDSDDSN